MIKVRNVATMMAIASLAVLPACGNMFGNRQAGTTTRTAGATATPAVSSDMVRDVQSRLQRDGYYKEGSVDGVWGSATQNAVMAFQRDHNLSGTGQLDTPTLLALNVAGDSAARDRTTINRGDAPPPPPPQNVAPANPNLRTEPPPAR